MKFRGSSNLRAPAWPTKQILALKGTYQHSLDLRRVKLPRNQSLDDLVSIDSHVQQLRKNRQLLATERNSLGKLAQKHALESGVRDHLDAGQLKTRTKQIKDELGTLEAEISRVEEALAELVDSVPNLVAPDTANVKGDYEIEAYLNDANAHMVRDKARDHVKVGTKLGILDMESGSRVSGTGHYYLIGQGALLEQALVQFALHKCREAGFRLVSPPTLVRQEFSEACGFQPRDDADVAQMYLVTGGGGTRTDPLSLVGTAEIPLAANLAHRQVPDQGIKHAGVCRSYRAEAGARGADTRGLYRVHEFTKVEMFMWTASDSVDESQAALRWLVDVQKNIVDSLELPSRVIKVAAHDLGAPAYQKYDIETWMPGRGDWGEISSASNCTDFQSRRLHTTNKKGQYVHTLNGTALAVPRIIVALLETGWEPERGIVRLPKALHPFIGTSHLEKEI